MTDQPSHGPWCNFKARPWRCKCGDPVFFGSCDHGRRVFCDRLGDTWPIHRCSYYSPPLTAEEAFQAKFVAQIKKDRQDQEQRERVIEKYSNHKTLSAVPGMTVDLRGAIVGIEHFADLCTLLNIPKGARNRGKDITRLTMAMLNKWILVDPSRADDQFVAYEFFMNSIEHFVFDWSILHYCIYPKDKASFT